MSLSRAILVAGRRARDLSPIVIDGGPMHAAPSRICPSLLEPARVQPDFSAMDEVAEWMHTGGREVIARKLAEVES